MSHDYIEPFWGFVSSFSNDSLIYWTELYRDRTANSFYMGDVGSGSAINMLKNDLRTEFAVVDVPLSQEHLDAWGFCQFPLTLGGLVPIIHVEGIQAGQLKLDGETLSRIFQGTITRWNDPAITALNPGLSLPAQKITLTPCPGDSGSGYNFYSYLARFDSAWKHRIRLEEKEDPHCISSGRMCDYVLGKPGSIGFTSMAWLSCRKKMCFTQMKNNAGVFVTPSLESFQAAVDTVDWRNWRTIDQQLAHAPGAAAWPLTIATWIVFPKKSKRPNLTEQVLEICKLAFVDYDAREEIFQLLPPPEMKAGFHAFVKEHFPQVDLSDEDESDE